MTAVAALVVLVLGSDISTAFAEGDLQEKIELCTTCHGETGLPAEKEVPIIWGQHFYYLYVQLKDYKAGRRANEVMQGIVEDMSRQDMRALAQHFAEKPWPKTGFRSDAKAASAGQSATGAGQCVQCHLGGYEGNSRVPRTAGQTKEYLQRTMQEFKDKTRKNSPAKGSLMSSYSEKDIENMAEFLAGL